MIKRVTLNHIGLYHHGLLPRLFNQDGLVSGVKPYKLQCEWLSPVAKQRVAMALSLCLCQYKQYDLNGIQ